jgi:hypothetical protein
MFINDIQKNATIALANFAAAGAIGLAAATVDIASSFVITQTAAGVALTLPTPTDATAGDRLTVGSDFASTQNFSVNGSLVEIGQVATFVWSGTAWLSQIGGRNTGAVVTVPTIAANANFTVAHNLAMPAGSFSAVIASAYNAAGNEFTMKRNNAGDTANVMGFYSPVAIAAPLTFYFSPLA